MSLTPQQVEVLQSSFRILEPLGATAADLFYRRLFELDPSVVPLFKGDMKEQGLSLIHISIAHAGTDQHVHGVQRVRLAGRRLVQAAARWQLDQLGLANAGALNFVDEEVAAPSGVFGDLTAILAGQGNEGHVGPLIGVVCCRPEARHSAGSSVQSNATAVPPVGPMPWGCCDRHLRPIRHAARRTEVFENCRFGSSDGMDCHS